jgi:hypothetical protein
MVEYVPIKHKTLNFKPQYYQKKKRRRRRRRKKKNVKISPNHQSSGESKSKPQ